MGVEEKCGDDYFTKREVREPGRCRGVEEGEAGAGDGKVGVGGLAPTSTDHPPDIQVAQRGR